MIGSAAALGPGDIITCQYRETGVYKQRGFELKDFMSQLMHNKNDPGKGRNMPVHYSGRLKTGVVRPEVAAERRKTPTYSDTIQHAVASTLGTQIPHAVDAAYALKLEDQETGNKSPRVAVAISETGRPVKEISTERLISPPLETAPSSSSAKTTDSPSRHPPPSNTAEMGSPAEAAATESRAYE